MGSRVLIMTAVDAEKDAVIRGLRGDARFDVRLAGVGPALAAARTATALAEGRYDRVVSMGIAGGFADRAPIGSIVVATDIVAADLGVETADGFSGVDELGFGSVRVEPDLTLGELLVSAMRGAGLTVAAGPVVTVATATGTAATAAERERRVPGASAEGMEGHGVAVAAFDRGVPVLEIRAVSNAVGPRDRAAWRIGDALRSLEAASAILSEVIE